MVRESDARWGISYQQQCLKFLAVLLDKQIYGQHQDIKRKNCYYRSYSHDDEYYHTQEKGRLPGVELVGIDVIAMPVKKLGEGIVSGIGDVKKKPVWTACLAWGKTVIAPFNK